MNVTHGQIWLVGLDPTVPNEQRGTRPCVVISTDLYNMLPIRHAIIVPLTSRDRGLPHHVEVTDDGGLDRRSWATCEAVRAVSTQRFGRLISTADAPSRQRIATAVARWLP